MSKPHKMLGGQPKRTLVPGGFTSHPNSRPRTSKGAHEEIVQAANRVLEGRGFTFLRHNARNVDRRMP